ncbi:MAG: hypothetical protein AAJB65_00325 [Candidatus Hodgkinia cicadicola]
MSRLNLLTTLDLAVCSGLVSTKPAILMCSVSLATQTIIYSSLREFLFFFKSLSLNAPSLLLVGNSVYNYVNVSWIKFNKYVNNIFH